MKEEKIKIAMEKLAEASVTKVRIAVEMIVEYRSACISMID